MNFWELLHSMILKFVLFSSIMGRFLSIEKSNNKLLKNLLKHILKMKFLNIINLNKYQKITNNKMLKLL